MFEKKLAEQLKRIFAMAKVTYDRPGESQEQEALFIEISAARCRVKDGRQISRATGTIHIFSQLEKIPFGYIAKCVAAADPADTAGLFFYNFEENKGTFRNIAERSADFLFLYDSQYDPNLGTLNQVNLSVSET